MITVTILAKNNEDTIRQTLDSVASFQEVIVYDTGSTDQTLEIARSYPNVKVYEGELTGFGPTHNKASSFASNDWVLSIDSDEVVTPQLVAEIQSSKLNPNTVYEFPRHNYFNGKWIRWCGWYPDCCLRLYNKSKTEFSDDFVHETIKKQGMQVQTLRSPILHYSYRDISDFLTKMQSYSQLFAEQNKGKKKSGLFTALFHGLYTFFKCYVLKRGFLGGYEGFVISLYNAHTAYYKYLKLHELNRAK